MILVCSFAKTPVLQGYLKRSAVLHKVGRLLLEIYKVNWRMSDVQSIKMAFFLSLLLLARSALASLLYHTVDIPSNVAEKLLRPHIYSYSIESSSLAPYFKRA